MKGKYHIELRNSKVKYSLDIERNITVIKGNSGTGKTSFYQMVVAYEVSKKESGVHCNVQDMLVSLRKDTDWKEALNSKSGKIFVADESVRYIYSKDFASAIKSSDNYFILISRRPFVELSYSVNSIYEMTTEYDRVTKLSVRAADSKMVVRPDLVITEDSKSGKEMMELVVNGSCDVITSFGSHNVYKTIVDCLKKYHTIYVLVDGAAFGSQLDRVLGVVDNARVFLRAPESFEYLLLTEDHMSRNLQGELYRTYDYCDSVKYLSWERYYTDLLNTVLKSLIGRGYSKDRLDAFFKNSTFVNHVRKELGDII